MKSLLSKAGRQTGFPVYPVVHLTMVDTLGSGESEIIRDLFFEHLGAYFNLKIKSIIFLNNLFHSIIGFYTRLLLR
ncbi:MAG: hypothetical protein MAG581_02338 [Deltaproteobacteria bacterium]|jgi:hypothetical protein|nr:hypothetical protein [Deltaproteobacteria bacterium]